MKKPKNKPSEGLIYRIGSLVLVILLTILIWIFGGEKWMQK